MDSEAHSRPILPHDIPGQGVMSTNAGTKEPVQRNYVFVDEHNRHKRLKVMRACEGCRRRKIKCDSATTNTWPCAACVRLKVECIPPTTNFDKEPTAPGVHVFELQKSHSYPNVTGPSITRFNPHIQAFQDAEDSLPSPYSESTFYRNDYGVTDAQHDLSKSDHISDHSDQESSHQLHFQDTESISHGPMSEKQWTPEAEVQNLATAFGDLNIQVDGTSAYITEHRKSANAPAVQEYEPELPTVALSPGARVRIPDEMMPTEQQALEHFEYFFTNIHPFMPVLCRTDFYHRWNTNRDAISPLLLEAIFACTTAALKRHTESRQWLALASKHEEDYKDSSRLSTVQALLLFMKAREAQPKRGYFYRSWMTLVNIIMIAKDLGLADHLRSHREDNMCEYKPAECISRTRIWQLCWVLECMIGGPQGRHDFSIKKETVDLNEPQVMAGIDQQENHISHQYVYLARIVFNVRETIDALKELGNKDGSYAAHPKFTSVDKIHHSWLEKLPVDLQIRIPENEYDPWMSTPFIGHIHTYYYLSLIMHYRPQFHYFYQTQPDSNIWKRPLLICLDAAKKISRINDSILATVGLSAFEFMLRGLSYAIYAVLTCTALQLAAITAPDPDINNEARDYFVKSMRFLERLTPSWPMESIRGQIDALRTAFSADMNEPFELRPGFPFVSSPTPTASIPEPAVQKAAFPTEMPYATPSHAHLTMVTQQPLTPPLSIIGESEPHIPHSLSMLGQPPASAMPTSIPQHDQWNPTQIFDKWQTAFYTAPQARPDQYSPTMQQMSVTNDYDLAPSSPTYPAPQHQRTQPQYYHRSSPTDGSGLPMSPNIPGPQGTPGPGPTSYPTSYQAEFVSPSAWQNAVASTYGSRLKRGWDGTDGLGHGPSKKHMS